MSVAFTTLLRARRPLELRDLEAFEPRPEGDVRRGRPLRLERAEALDRARGGQARSLQQELPREQRAVQLPQREDAFGYRGKLSSSHGRQAPPLLVRLAPVRHLLARAERP